MLICACSRGSTAFVMATVGQAISKWRFRQDRAMAAKTQTAPEVPTERPRTASSLSSGSRLESLSGTEGRSSLTPTKSHRKNSGSGSGSASGSGAPGHNEIQQEFQRFFLFFFFGVRPKAGLSRPSVFWEKIPGESGLLWNLWSCCGCRRSGRWWFKTVARSLHLVVAKMHAPFKKGWLRRRCLFVEKRIHKLASLKQDKGFWPDRCLQGSLRTMSTFEQI